MGVGQGPRGHFSEIPSWSLCLASPASSDRCLRIRTARPTTHFDATYACSAGLYLVRDMGHDYCYFLPVSHLKIGMMMNLPIVKDSQSTLAALLRQQMLKLGWTTGNKRAPTLYQQTIFRRASQKSAGF